jgi:Uma2 family endonuclease
MNIATAESKFVLGPEHNGMLMTPQEFDAIEQYDDTYHYELIHGMLIVNPFPLESEVGPNEVLGAWLYIYKTQHPQGAALDATLPGRYVRTKDSRRRADRVIWAGFGRMPDWKRDLPTIAVEFVSAASRDRRRDYIEKRLEYLKLGVAEYWIIDRFKRTMTVVRKKAKALQDTVLAEKETFRTPLLPGFELPLARLLEVADQMAIPPEPRRRRGR